MSLRSLPNMKVAMRVVSVQKARMMRSIISRQCRHARSWSLPSNGARHPRAAGPARGGGIDAALLGRALISRWMRRSTSRTEVRYSSSLRWSVSPSLALGWSCRRARSRGCCGRPRAQRHGAPGAGAARPPWLRNRRSKARLGSISSRTGVVGVLHDELVVVEPRPARVDAAHRRLHAEMERGEAGDRAGAARRQLVGRDAADIDVGAGGLLHHRAGEEAGLVGVVGDRSAVAALFHRLPSSSMSPVSACSGLSMRLELGQRPGGIRLPFLAVGAAGQVHQQHAHRRARRAEARLAAAALGGIGRCGPGRRHGLKQRQGDGDAEPPSTVRRGIRVAKGMAVTPWGSAAGRIRCIAIML